MRSLINPKQRATFDRIHRLEQALRGCADLRNFDPRAGEVWEALWLRPLLHETHGNERNGVAVKPEPRG